MLECHNLSAAYPCSIPDQLILGVGPGETSVGSFSDTRDVIIMRGACETFAKSYLIAFVGLLGSMIILREF